jgi:hypothetical protein
MGEPRGVPGAPRNGSRPPSFRACAANVAGITLAVVVAWGATCGCLEGDAEPIVRVAADGGGGASACPAEGPYRLFYRAAQAATTADSIDFLFKIQNASGASLPLASLAVRYYFTSEVAAPQTSVYYADECCAASRTGFTADVAVTVNATPTATATADHYIEVTFDAGAGSVQDGDSVQVEVGFFAPLHAQTLNQANDYSFIATSAGTQAQWDLCPPQCAQFQSCVMTAYLNGTLIWGTPP